MESHIQYSRSTATFSYSTPNVAFHSQVYTQAHVYFNPDFLGLTLVPRSIPRCMHQFSVRVILCDSSPGLMYRRVRGESTCA